MAIGEIDALAAKAAGVKAGPIRLLQGNRSWGLRHVEGNAHRCKEIGARGFSGPKDFAFQVADGWTSLRAGEAGKIAVVMARDGHELGLALKWTGTYWSVVTMLPFREVHKTVLYEK